MIYILLTVLCVLAYLRLKRSNTIPLSLEVAVNEVLCHVDDGIDDDGLGLQEVVHRGRLRAILVQSAKNEFGLIKRSMANHHMVRKFMRDKMRERGVRPKHIQQNLDVAVACFFIPSVQDVLARQVGATRVAIERDEQINTAWQSAYRFVTGMLGFEVS